jgi:hypothetical protein
LLVSIGLKICLLSEQIEEQISQLGKVLQCGLFDIRLVVHAWCAALMAESRGTIKRELRREGK